MGKFLRNYVILFFLSCFMLQPTITFAKVRMGTRTLHVGEEIRLEVANERQTVTGSWKITEGNACRISARGTKSCKITAIRVGNCTVTWTGVIDAGWYDDYYWDITVIDPPPPPVISGPCGDNLKYTYEEATKTLTISGSGDMWNFGNEHTLPWLSYRSNIEKVIIENGVSSIGILAFDDSSSLRNISLENLSSIGDYAFSKCTKLTSVRLGEKLKKIGNGAFHECSGLTSLIIPDNVKTIGDYAFAYCSNLESVSIGKGLTTFGDAIFVRCENLTDVEINCKEIYNYNLLLNGIKETIKRIVIGNEVLIIEEEAFKGSSNLSSVSIGKGVKQIGRLAFAYCPKLTTLYIPNNVETLGELAFSNCESLSSITLSDQIIEIEPWTFEECKNLSTIHLPQSLKTIGNGAFQGCETLSSLSFPSSLTNIYSTAFSFCDNLETIEIPASLIEIGSCAFSDCKNLKTVISLATEPFLISSLAFAFREKQDGNTYVYRQVAPGTLQATLYVPYGTKTKYENTSGWNVFKTIIEGSPSGILNIGQNNEEVNKQIFNLRGEKLKAPQKGLNIISGKKVLFK